LRLRTEGAVSFEREEVGGRTCIVEAIKDKCCDYASKGKLVADAREEGLLCWNRHGGHCISRVAK
jgi:hypothetical protein